MDDLHGWQRVTEFQNSRSGGQGGSPIVLRVAMTDATAA